VPRVLLTTVHRPLGVESETSSRNIVAEMYHAQVTRAQGPFSVRTVCTGWGIELIAANLEAPTTVLHYPTLRRLVRELRKGYDFIGISFVVCTFPKTVELCRLVRRVAPRTKIVLGGYGTVLQECDRYADFVCREEGIGFFRRLLGEPPLARLVVPRIRRTLRVMSVTARPEFIVPAGLGCSRGCDFCCTSHFFDRRTVPLLPNGRALHEAMRACEDPDSTFRNVGVIDEDFLADRGRIEEMLPLNAAEVERPILFSCLTSFRSLAQYTTDELLAMGLAGVWVGFESRRADFPKLKGVDPAAAVRELERVGIIPLVSMIIGLDGHDEKSVEEDFQYFLSLAPAFSQLMIYSPCPKTPLYRRLEAEGRLLGAPYKDVDGFHALFSHPRFTKERLEALVEELFRREYEELGPSVLRVLDIQLAGYRTLKGDARPHIAARVREYRRLCLDLYPLLGTALRRAPSPRVRSWLKGLDERVREEFRIPAKARLAAAAAPALALYTTLQDWLIPNPQPRTEVHHYRCG